MNESQPPVLEEKPATNRFAKFAAIFSILAPPVAFLIFFVCGYGRIGLKMVAVVGLLPLPVIFLGLIFGIVALVTVNGIKAFLLKQSPGFCLMDSFCSRSSRFPFCYQR